MQPRKEEKRRFYVDKEIRPENGFIPPPLRWWVMGNGMEAMMVDCLVNTGSV